MSKRRILLLLGSGLFVALGIFGARILYGFPPVTQSFFSWSEPTPYSPLVAVLIGLTSAGIVALWIVFAIRKERFGSGLRVLVSISLIWCGFAGGLLGPWALGREGAHQNTLSSVVYGLELEEFSIPGAVGLDSPGRPGPFFANTPSGEVWLALNSGEPPLIRGGETLQAHTSRAWEAPSVTLMRASLDGGLTVKSQINLTGLVPSIQHVRDLAVGGGRLLLSNIEAKAGCLELQVWQIDLEAAEIGPSSVEQIWQSSPCLTDRPSPEGEASGAQSGGRIILEPSGDFLITVGDFRMGLSVPGPYSGRPTVLGPDTSYGKVLRVNAAGEAVTLSAGHRNPQGLAMDSESGMLWLTEHGPQSGGELNLLGQDLDFGWPDVTLGVPYNSSALPAEDWKVGRWASRHEGFSSPTYAWMPSVAPSQLIVYRGANFEAWRGDLIVGTLKDKSLRRLRLDGERVLFDERIYLGFRVRDIGVLNDGRILLSSDQGRLYVLGMAEE